MAAKPIPDGYHSATPYLIVKDAARAIEFYKQAFGATELVRLAEPSGKVAHAEIQIGDSPIMISEESPDWGNYSPQSLGGSPVGVHLYVEDVDAVTSQAVAAGAKVLIPVADQFYGDRSGRLADPFGHFWILATHKEDVTREEMARRFEAFIQKQSGVESEASDPPRPAGAGLVGDLSEAPRLYRVILPAGDIEQSVGFYRRLLEMEGERISPGRHYFTCGGVILAVVDPRADGDDRDANPNSDHVYLAVRSLGPYHDRASQLGALSPRLGSIETRPWGERSFYLQDPFGNPLCLVDEATLFLGHAGDRSKS